jgi:hypothetical protein
MTAFRSGHYSPGASESLTVNYRAAFLANDGARYKDFFKQKKAEIR